MEMVQKRKQDIEKAHVDDTNQKYLLKELRYQLRMQQRLQAKRNAKRQVIWRFWFLLLHSRDLWSTIKAFLPKIKAKRAK